TAKEGRVCMVINQSCCAYVDQTQRVETDLKAIWERVKTIHQVSFDDTSWGFTDLWNRITGWLPNLAWLKSLFVALVMFILFVMMTCILIQCASWCCKGGLDDYATWKRHRIKHQVESGNYFKKT
ncbi:ERVV2 protein, partial [Anseranas semipalmata]|nr:ERVV2 protein [Anseranas semipalmata]